MSRERLFGTDGIRGQVNTYPMVPELVCAVGRAVARVLAAEEGTAVVVGTDTRQSADLFACAAAAGVCAAGRHALMAGVLPTPGIARLTSETAVAAAAVVVSASHNPYTDNGVKLFDGAGFKLTDEMEQRVEAAALQLFSGGPAALKGDHAAVGRVETLSDAETRYLDFLKAGAPSLEAFRIVLDCANGAAHRVGPRLLHGLGATVRCLGDAPDGKNINDGCGSEHPEGLCNAVRQSGADIGLALDGDADRVVAVDETGEVVTGDQLIAVFASAMKRRGLLSNDRVVTTVMSNLGLGRALGAMGVEHRISAVGDRRVLLEMKRSGAVLGGEDSGHLVFLDAHSTGDGLYAALRLLGVLRETGQPLSRLKQVMRVYPQVLMNVPVGRKPPIEKVAEITEAIRKVERALGDTGRVLVRYSGTQPLCRVMVEGPGETETRRACERVARAVAEAIGG